MVYLKNKIILLSAIVIICINACTKPKTYPDTPYIEFVSFVLKDTIDNPDLQNPVKMGILKFSFIDGDGDIGLNQEDTMPPFDTSSVYYYNLYFTMYNINNGKINEVELPFPLNFRTPYVTPKGQNKTLKGWILTEFTYNYPLQYDSIFYTFYIYDRAQHMSNIASTDTIVITE